MSKSVYLLAPATAIFLSACSSGGDTAAITPTYGPGGVTITKSTGQGSGALTTTQFDNLATAFDALDTAIGSGTYTAPSPRPTGNVTMTGYMAVNDTTTPDETILGNLSMTADFNGNSVSGTAGDFATFDTTGASPVIVDTFNGTLTLAGSNVGTGITATANGTITRVSDSAAIGVASNLSGNLYDVEGNLMYVGDVTGTFTVNGGSGGSLTGDFVAQD